CPGLADELLGPVDALDRRERWLAPGVEMPRQSFDLLRIEHRVGFQKRDTLFGFLPGVVCRATGESVAVDDRGARFAAADLPAKLLCLLVGHPNRALVTVQEGTQPQHHHVDAPVRLAAAPQRPGDRTGGMTGAPGLYPGAHAGFQSGDDLVGDAAVN